VTKGSIDDLSYPTTLIILQPIVSSVGQLTNNQIARANFKFNQEFTYDRKYLFWVKLNLPSGKCRDIQVRVNKRDFYIPFNATILFDNGSKRTVEGVYQLHSRADMQARHRVISCP
jgi:hypothetical protein